jgi:hypothetical protein
LKRARVLYFSFLGTALALSGAAAAVTPHIDGSWSLALLRFVVLALAIVTGVATWYTAVMIASRHKVGWPLLLTMAIVIVAGGGFLLTFFLAPTPEL